MAMELSMEEILPVQELPSITPDLPGLGGQIKSEPGYFVVDELPLYEPAGRGDHLYLRLAREGLTTRDLVKRLAGLFGLREVDIGCAGQKDKHARAIQTFSVLAPGRDAEETARRIESELPVQVLWTRRHSNKLRTGHLLGNRFILILSGPKEDALAAAERIAEALQARGWPNYYGEQRFGGGGDNASRGLAALKGRGPRQPWLRRWLGGGAGYC